METSDFSVESVGFNLTLVKYRGIAYQQPKYPK